MNHDTLDIFNNVDVLTSYCAPDIGTHSANVLVLICPTDTVSSYSRVVQNYLQPVTTGCYSDVSDGP